MACEIGPSLELLTGGGELYYQAQDALCSTCSKINWAEIVHNPDSAGRSAGRWRCEHVPSMCEMRQNYRCPFCRLCTRAKNTLDPGAIIDNSEKGLWQIVWYGQEWDNETSRGGGDNYRERIRDLMTFRLQLKPPRTLNSRRLNSSTPIEVMVHAAEVSEYWWKYRSGQFITATETNPHLLQRWRSRCENSHGNCHSSSTWDRLGLELMEKRCFRLIDVEDLQVRPAEPGCKYVSLSYVWGTGKSFRASLSNFKNPDKTSPKGYMDLSTLELPRTVADAILATKLLGERYLWVDALCIIQDDVEDMAVNIRAMDSIYKASVLTIVAAAGNDSAAGLPGVRQGSRFVEQIIEEVDNMTFMIPQPPLKNLLNNASWSTRAWTYQEELFSRRKLIFTGGLVYYKCNEDVWSEDIFEEGELKFVSERKDDIFARQHDKEEEDWGKSNSGESRSCYISLNIDR